jgi:putative hydrolase of the HAD superfamily
MIKAVLFDLDGTLFDRDSCVRALVQEQYSAFKGRLETIKLDHFVNRVLTLDEHGYRNKSEVYETLAREHRLPAGTAAELTADFWTRYHTFCRPYDDLLGTLEELKHRGKRIGVITNGTQTIQEGTMDALGIRELLDVVLVSETEGVRKPDPAIFERAATRLGLLPSECCFVGDHPEVDIAGAKAASWWPVWKRSSHWSPPAETVLTIDTLSEVLLHI